MNCIIDNVIQYYAGKGKRSDVIRRYLRMKYHINIDHSALKARIRDLRHISNPQAHLSISGS